MLLLFLTLLCIVLKTYSSNVCTDVDPSWKDLTSSLPTYPQINNPQMANLGDGNIMMFGGIGRETWVFNGTSWTDLTSSLSVSPTARSGNAMATCGDGNIMMFGGYNGSYLGDTWIFNGTSWTDLTSSLSVSPPVRIYHAMDNLGDGNIRSLTLYK